MNMKKQFNNFIEVERMLQFLDIQDVTTKRQKANGTREFKLPVKCQYGGAIHVASFASGYVRRTKAGSYFRIVSSWQLNKRCESEPRYYNIDGKHIEYTTRTCKLIPNEQDRLEYLISFCLKNYYIGYANMLSSGEFVPRWKYDSAIEDRDNQAWRTKVKDLENKLATIQRISEH